jgi:hypothetical protein
MISINWRVLYTVLKGLLVTTGPLAQLLQRYGVSAGDAQLWIDLGAWLLSVVGLVLLGDQATDRKTIAAAAQVEGVTKIKIDPTPGAASAGAVAAAADDNLPNVKRQA